MWRKRDEEIAAKAESEAPKKTDTPSGATKAKGRVTKQMAKKGTATTKGNTKKNAGKEAHKWLVENGGEIENSVFKGIKDGTITPTLDLEG